MYFVNQIQLASSSPTTTVPSTTTTTTLPARGCDGEPVSATFASIDCRLAALLERVRTTSNSGTFGSKITKNIGEAKDAEEAGAGFCTSSDLKRTRQQLNKAIRALIDYVHRLKGHAGRRKLQGLREEFITAADPIKSDLKRLKSTVSCPADAPVEDGLQAARARA